MNCFFVFSITGLIATIIFGVAFSLKTLKKHMNKKPYKPNMKFDCNCLEDAVDNLVICNSLCDAQKKED